MEKGADVAAIDSIRNGIRDARGADDHAATSCCRQAGCCQFCGHSPCSPLGSSCCCVYLPSRPYAHVRLVESLFTEPPELLCLDSMDFEVVLSLQLFGRGKHCVLHGQLGDRH